MRSLRHGDGSIRFFLACGAGLVVLGAMVFLFRGFFFRPFAVRGDAMAGTLLPGDRIWAGVWRCGIFSGEECPPEIGELLLFSDPLNPGRTMMGRCMAVSGQTVEIASKSLLVDGERATVPESAKRSLSAFVPGHLSSRDEMGRQLVPSPGDTVLIPSGSGIGFDFVRTLVIQENPGKRVATRADLMVDGEKRNRMELKGFRLARGPFASLDFDSMTWLDCRRVLEYLRAKHPQIAFEINRYLAINDTLRATYVVKRACFFAMNDHWDRAGDSRLWGYVSEMNVIGRPKIVYWSWRTGKRWYHFPFNVRWSRFGKRLS